MTDNDDRNEVSFYKHKTGMYDREESTITLKSKDESIDSLLKKAREFVKE